MSTKNYLNHQDLNEILKQESAFREKQFYQYFLNSPKLEWTNLFNYPQKLRTTLDQTLYPIPIRDSKLFHSKDGTTKKALLTLKDQNQIETVLMGNPKQQYTLCLSSQVGCAMKCQFCETGKMGFIRNLDRLEILYQIRYWQDFLKQNQDGKNSRISNLVFMGMGEPLLNYEEVTQSIEKIKTYTDIGLNYVTLSTVGIRKKLDQLLEDPHWPPIQLAISLHSAREDTRKSLIPSHEPDFIPYLKSWCKKYIEKHCKRTRPLTFEYVLIKGINDTKEEALALCHFLKGLKRAKVNLIPYNQGSKKNKQEKSEAKKIEQFRKILDRERVTHTLRNSKGQDIGAACGQLLTLEKNQRKV